MSTSLKIQHADEILEAMAMALGEKLEKTAAGSALEAYKAALASVVDENGLINAWKMHMDALNQEESTNEALQLQAAKARELGLPGYATPTADDVQMAEEKVCELCGQVVKEQEPEPMPVEPDEGEPEPMAWDAPTSVAADFAMKQLVKVADALDGKGFKEVANLIDEALQKLASKKKV
jgi:hypothetical protein